MIVDFTTVPKGSQVTLLNIGPDEPFGGGVPGVDFTPADPGTIGQVMQFGMVERRGRDISVPPRFLRLPQLQKLGTAKNVRKVSLNEEESKTVLAVAQADGSSLSNPDNPDAVAFGPTKAQLGTVNPDGTGNPLDWDDQISENPALSAVEEGEIHNITEDG